MNKEEKETFLGGVESCERSVPVWLLIVYGVLIVWGLYYLIKYWGGWGPGL